MPAPLSIKPWVERGLVRLGDWEWWLKVHWEFRETQGFWWRGISALSQCPLHCWSLIGLPFLGRIFCIGSFPWNWSSSLCSNCTALASFLISNKFYWMNKKEWTTNALDVYLRCQTISCWNYKRNSKIVEKENSLVAEIQSNKARRNCNLRSRMSRLQSSKPLEFQSLHKHHIRQCGIVFQILTLQNLPNLTCQQANRSNTLLGMTHWTPNMENTKDHKS